MKRIYMLAMLTDSFAASRKSAKQVLWVQSLSQVIYCVGTLILKGYSGAVQNLVSILRNLAAIRGVKSRAAEWIFVGLGVVFGLAFNNLGLVGLLPVIANLEYTVVVFRCGDDEWALKLAFLFCTLLFTVFNAAIFNFVGAAANTVVSVTTIIFLIKHRRGKANAVTAEKENEKS